MRLLICLLIFALASGPSVFCAEQTHGAQAAHIIWQPWSEAAFEQAQKEHKLVILDLEAVWCHWCHVMEERTYSNSAVAKLMNDHFIALKVDQDSRPDLSNKYQDYGWPATIIFKADGTELAKKAGFIPPDEMTQLLSSLVKNPVPEESSRAKQIKFSAATTLGDSLRKELTAKHIKGYDTKNGAWSFGQKFLEADSVEYALTRAKEGDTAESHMARQTLDQQLHLLDPAWGGMYQYSTQFDWDHPHFEKIMSVQSDNMRMYSLGYLLFQDSKYLATAESIYRYLTSFLLSPDGAFYTSQDADVVQGEHSDAYFKLSDELRRKQGIPRIDKHIYSRENGWAIAGIVALYEATGDAKYLDTATRAADWIIAHRQLPGGGFSHDEKDTAGPYLGDSLYMGAAVLKLYEATGDRRWLQRATEAANFIAANFKQPDGAPGFVTAVAKGKVAKPEPLLDENMAAARFFALLSRYAAKTEYKALANNAVSYLATPEIAAQRKIFVAGILLADREVNADPVHITILGSKTDPQAMALFKAALRYPVSYKQVEWLDRAEGALPSGEAEFPTLPRAAAFGCAFHRCSLPIYKPENISKIVDSFNAQASQP